MPKTGIIMKANGEATMFEDGYFDKNITIDASSGEVCIFCDDDMIVSLARYQKDDELVICGNLEEDDYTGKHILND